MEELQPERDLSRSPLFPGEADLAERAEWRRSWKRGAEWNSGGGEAPIEGADGEVDLTMVITDEGRDLVGLVDYSRDLFEDGTIERLMSHYGNVLKGIAERWRETDL